MKGIILPAFFAIIFSCFSAQNTSAQETGNYAHLTAGNNGELINQCVKAMEA
jgi:hypothetical protein